MKLFNKKEKKEVYSAAEIKKQTDNTSFLQDLIKLLFKVAMIGLALVLLFSFIFGAFRYNDLAMMPAVKDGDMVICYRWDKRYYSNDLVVFWYNDEALVGRVVATGGQTVDIDKNSVMVDGHSIADASGGQDTTLVKDGVSFPLTVPDGSVFVLGDNRTKAVDSRTFGCVEIDKSEGKVIGLFRHRGF